MALTPGVVPSDLLDDADLRAAVRRQIAGAVVLVEGHIQPQDVTVDEVFILEDYNAKALNCHDGVHDGRKRVRFDATMVTSSALLFPARGQTPTSPRTAALDAALAVLPELPL